MFRSYTVPQKIVLNQYIPHQQGWGGQSADNGVNRPPPFVPQGAIAPSAHRHLPMQGQPPADIAATVTLTVPLLLPKGATHALFFPMDAAGQAAAEAHMAATVAEQAAATV